MMITVQTEIHATLESVWECWTKPEHIIQWNFASDDWCCPRASNELRPGGTFNWRMEAKDGSMGFDFTGIYENVEVGKSISYKMEDGRNVNINFKGAGDKIILTESFDAEGIHSEEQQRAGWQAILDNFKLHVESQE